MNQFTFEGKTKSLLIGGMVVGVISMVLTLFMGDDSLHTRFWSNFLHNSVFFTGIAFMALFASSAFIAAWAGWYVLAKRVLEALTMFIGIGAIFMLVLAIGNYLGLHHLYHWTDAEAVANDPILLGKAAFLNKGVYLLTTVVFMGLWVYFAWQLRKLSKMEDEAGSHGDYTHHNKMRVYAAAFLPIAGVTSAILIWLWLMSVDAHWYSTLYAWYAASSWWVSMLAFTILLIYFLQSKGYLQSVGTDITHDLGKYMFGFSVFWTYLWFSQYMLIWYGNIGEETIYFHTRLHEYPVLFYLILVLNFPIPFLVLMSNSNKRKAGTMIFTAMVVIFGHWLDFFMMIKPGVRHTAEEHLAHAGHGAEAAADHGGHAAETAGHGAEAGHEVVEHVSHFMMGFNMPGLLEIGTFIGFLSLFLFVIFSSLTKARLQPEHDPYMEESAHHHV